MCPYYPARAGPARLTIAEVTESETMVGSMREREREEKAVVERRRVEKRQLIITNPQNIPHKHCTLTLTDFVHHFCLRALSLASCFAYL